MFLYFFAARRPQVSRISCSVGIKTRICPSPFSLFNSPMASTAASTQVMSPLSSSSLSMGRYLTSTGYMRPDTSIMGASSKALENFSGSIVAEVIIILRSLLFLRSVLSMPSIKSMFMLRSWASSTMSVSYSFR